MTRPPTAAEQSNARKRWTETLDSAERTLKDRPAHVEMLARALRAASKLEKPDVFRRHARGALAVPPAARPQLPDKRVGDLALAAGAHDVAARIGRALLPTDRGVGSYLLASATWEAGEVAVADRIIADALACGGSQVQRSAIDYRLRLDDVDGAADLLEEGKGVDVAALVTVAQGFQAKGDSVRALETIEWARRRRVSAPGLDAVEAAARPVCRLMDGSWLPAAGLAEHLGVDPQSDRVLHVVTRSLPYYTAGGTVRTQEVVRAQRDAGLNAVVVTSLGFPWSHGHSSAGDTTEVDGVTYHHIGPEVPAELPIDEPLRRTLEALLPLVRELRPAVLHPASDFRNALVALALGKELGVPVVYEVRGFPEDRLRRRRGSRAWRDRSVAKRELERRCALAADHVVTLASVMKDHLFSRGVERDRITIIPNGVDLSRFEPMPRDERLASRLGIDRDHTVIGYVSTLKAYEGIETILEAVAELRARGTRAWALLVGSGDHKETLRGRARELGIEPQVTFVGRVDHRKVHR
jgi:glycosyltransferase involved in cell wall biosynthesis